MASNYRTPGVYIEEEPAAVRPIQGVGTSTAALVGAAPNSQAHVGRPRAINNWMQFRREFVDDPDGQPLGGSTPLSSAVFSFFQNGGRLVWVLNRGAEDGALRLRDLEPLTPRDVQIVAAPGRWDAATHDTLLTYCENTKDRLAILDGPPEIDDLHALTRVATAEGPPPRGGPARGDGEDGEDGEDGGGGGAGRGGSAAGGGGGGSAPGGGEQGLRPRNSDGGYGAFYVPWYAMQDPLGDELEWVPPSGAVAGICARTDAERGVHKAPANTIVRGALNLQRLITDAEQEALNENGVNCIRYFPGRGNLVWGARTVAEASSPWRYLNVRRLFTMIEQSIRRGTAWVVFEPNDHTLWKTIRLSIGAFLTRVWRDGALFGTTAEEAYFVQCDEETNPPEDRDAGIVTTIVGAKPVKPAEFVVFRISQYEGGAEVATEGTSRV